MFMFLLPLLRPLFNRQTLVTLRNFRRSLFRFITMTQSNDDQSSSSDAPPPFDPLQPSTPISYPIKTLEDLNSRAYFDSFHYPFNKSNVPLQNAPLPRRPRILVCHDMQGGYVDDKWVQGGANADAYAIWHWYLMDVFVFFSHDLVTLPPPCWTNTAHRHGVKVLGTFITEWDAGKDIANEFLSTKESAHTCAERLAELAHALGFDGWLLNMEVTLDKQQIPNLIEFVSYLTQTMHSTVPGSLVIWYDSVTIDGDLSWQDQLNEKNKPFFDKCDGIFVNYSWKKEYPKRSATVAGDRKFDVYMGIDVFGRGTYGGGQWNTNVALDVLKEDDVSAAMFAPGWVYECKQAPDFETAQNRWWSLVEKSWGILQNYPKVLPFYSNFDQGRGLHIAVDGGQVSGASWHNISSQGFQPFLKFNDNPNADPIQVLVNFKEASYSGGGNITFKGTLEANDHFIARLFQGELLLGNLPVHLSYSVNSEENSLLGLLLDFSSAEKARKSVLFAPGGRNKFLSQFSEVIVPHRVEKPEMAPGWVIQENSIVMNGHTLTGISAVCYRPEHENSGRRLKSITDGQDIGITKKPAEYFAKLGHLTIKTSERSSDFPPSSSWLVQGQYIKWTSDSQGSRTLNIKIIWKLKNGKGSLFPKYNVYVKELAKQVAGNQNLGLEGTQKYLGVAHVEAFYVSNLAIPSGIGSLKFIIQVCATDGTNQKLNQSPFLQLDVDGA